MSIYNFYSSSLAESTAALPKMHPRETSENFKKEFTTIDGEVLKIEEIHVFPLRILVKESARISSWQYPYIESILVKLKTDNDVVGYGKI